jgi:predicted membrane-bound mannosyltransferase
MSPRAPWLYGSALAALFAVALLVRLEGLERRMLCHPENFVPGLSVPTWASSPPPADDLEAVLRRTPMDGHPPLYMLAMLPWVQAFGTGLGALRMPSVIFGVLSVVLLWRIGLREGGRWTALLAAALLALNGHHVFWSQMARMYVMASCLCLASTLCLLRLLAHGRRSDEALYVATTTAAVWTTEFGWPFLFAQLVWSTLESSSRSAAAERRARSPRRRWW